MPKTEDWQWPASLPLCALWQPSSSLSDLCLPGWAQSWRFVPSSLQTARMQVYTSSLPHYLPTSWNLQHFHFYFLVNLSYLKKFFLNSSQLIQCPFSITVKFLERIAHINVFPTTTTNHPFLKHSFIGFLSIQWNFFLTASRYDPLIHWKPHESLRAWSSNSHLSWFCDWTQLHHSVAHDLG